MEQMRATGPKIWTNPSSSTCSKDVYPLVTMRSNATPKSSWEGETA